MTKPENYRLSREKSSSPKRSPKLGHRPVEIKDYGPIDADLSQGTKNGSGSDFKLKNGDTKGRHYPPHAYTRSNSGVSLKHTNISSQPQSPAKKVNGLTPAPSPVTSTGNGKPVIANGSAGVSGIPSPRGKPPAPPVRRSSDLGSLETSEAGASEASESLCEVTGEEGGQPASVVTTSGSSVTNSYISRTCSLPRHKRMGKNQTHTCIFVTNVFIVQEFPVLVGL